MLNIKTATHEECLDILSEPRLFNILPIKPGGTLEEYLKTTDVVFRLMVFGKYKTLFHVDFIGRGNYQFHILCPKASIPQSRKMGIMAIYWAFHVYKGSIVSLYCECPHGKMANLCRKIGATELKSKNGMACFRVTPEYFKTSLLTD
tara:strand:- start:4800 stop:5240 length:441 start_codon:yes stop_codon:yes gene_type:complete